MPMFDPSEYSIHDAPSLIVAPAGTTCKLRIIAVRVAEDKNSNTYWQPTLEIVDEPLTKDFTHFLGRPSPTKSEKQNIRARRDLKDFMDCFQLDYSRPFDPSVEWAGAEGWAILGVSNREPFGLQNNITQLLPPEIHDSYLVS